MGSPREEPGSRLRLRASRPREYDRCTAQQHPPSDGTQEQRKRVREGLGGRDNDQLRRVRERLRTAREGNVRHEQSGWNTRRAELEAERIVQQIERGTWVPPRLEPREDRLEAAMADLGVAVDESFRVFARRWWRAKQLGLDADTVNDYEWRLGYIERFFGRYRLSEITPRVVDRFRDELHEQAEAIRTATARGRVLKETVTDKRGRTYERKRRPLSNTSINAMITLLGQVMQQALDYELIDRNPVRVGGRSARFLKRSRPNRTFLEVDEYLALLDAAGELEAEARSDFKGLGRRAMMATLTFAEAHLGHVRGHDRP